MHELHILNMIYTFDAYHLRRFYHCLS